MEIESKRKPQSKKLRVEKSPLKKLPAIKKSQMSKIKNLSWLKSLNSEKLQHSMSSKVVQGNSITRTKPFQIRVELEDIDQENRRLIQALNYVKTCNKELASIYAEEREIFEKVMRVFEESYDVNSSLKIDQGESLPSTHKAKGKSPKKFKKQIFLNQKTREENKQTNPGVSLSTKRRSQSLVHNIVLSSQQDIKIDSKTKIRGSFNNIRKSPKVNEVFSEVNPFELFAMDKKAFESLIWEILKEEPQFFPEPSSLDRSISLLNLFIQKMEKRIHSKRKTNAFAQFQEALFFNSEMKAEVHRLRILQDKITQDGVGRESAERDGLARANFKLEEEINELEQLIELMKQDQLELDEEIRERNNYINEQEANHSDMLRHNEAIMAELVRRQNEIDELQTRIQSLNFS
jgi:hypothetical protein